MRKLRLLTDCEGSALVEGALLIPVLFILIYGVCDFSWFFYQQQLVGAGVRDAARYLARLPDSCNPASSDRLIVQARARNLAATGTIDGVVARVGGWSAETITVDCTAVVNPVVDSGLKRYRGGPLVYVVNVSTRFVGRSLGFFSFAHLEMPVMSVSHSERVIGPG